MQGLLPLRNELPEGPDKGLARSEHKGHKTSVLFGRQMHGMHNVRVDLSGMHYRGLRINDNIEKNSYVRSEERRVGKEC